MKVLITKVPMHLNKNKWKVVLFSLFIHCFTVQSQELFFRKHLDFLASDSLKGRDAASPEAYQAAKYILNEFKNNGLHLLGEEGFQKFPLETEIDSSARNVIIFKDFQGQFNSDFKIPSSAFETKAAQMVLVAYNDIFSADSLLWFIYKGIDMKDKWVMIYRNIDTALLNALDKKNVENICSRELQYLNFKKAAGVLIYNDTSQYKLKQAYDEALPVLEISKDFSQQLISSLKLSHKNIADSIKTKGKYILFIEDSLKCLTSRKTVTSDYNILAMLPGNDSVLKKQSIIIGAHYDHLGYGDFMLSQTKKKKKVHYGADDNASGTAMMLELARRIALHRDSLRRSIVFIGFGAEEDGLIGSKFYVENPIFPIDLTKTMVNLDMVGRYGETKEGGLEVLAAYSSKEGLSILQKHETPEIRVIPKIDNPEASDHWYFTQQGIPSLFFFTGLSKGYHTPKDTKDRINYAAMVQIADYIEKVVLDIDHRDSALTFKDAPQYTNIGFMTGDPGWEPTLSFNKKEFKAYVLAVKPDSPAEVAGLQEGDRIMEAQGIKIKSSIISQIRLFRKLKKNNYTLNDLVIKRGNETIKVKLKPFVYN